MNRKLSIETTGKVSLRAGDTITSLCTVDLPAPFHVAQDCTATIEYDYPMATLAIGGVTVAKVYLTS